LSSIWTKEEIKTLKNLIEKGWTNKEIFENGMLEGRSFRGIKDKRTEISISNMPLRSPGFVSADYAKRNKLDTVKELKVEFNIEDDLEPIITKKEDGYTYQEIADALNHDFNYIKNKLEQWSVFKRMFNVIFNRNPKLEEVFFSSDDEYNLGEEFEFEELWSIFNDWIERKRTEIHIPQVSQDSNDTKKYLIIQDTHIPFHDEEFLVSIIEKHKNEIDGLIIAGDFLDCYSISPFPKYKDISLREELTEGVKILQYLSENVKEIIVITGNHERRVTKAIHRNLDKNMAFLIQTNLLDFISRGLALETIGHELSNIEVIDNWYYQIGDAIIGHPEIYSSVELKSAVKSYEWFKKWQGRLNLDEFRFISHAHTHKAGVAYVEEASKLHMVVETGACCLTQDYAIRAESRGKYTPPQNGYVLLIQENGKTNLNRTRLFIQDVYQ